LSKFTNHQVAEVFANIADMLEIQGEIIYKILAYRKAADNILHLGRDINDVWREGRLREIPGVGQAIAEKIDELLRTGQLDFYERLKKEIPPGVVSLLSVPDVGPKTAKLLFERLGIDSITALEEAARAGKLRDLPGLGAKSEQKIIAGIEALSRRTRRIPLGTAWPVVEELLTALRQVPGVVQASAAGSLRRMRPTVGDLDLLVATAEPESVMAGFRSLPQVSEVMLSGTTKTSVLLHNGLQVDLRALEPARWGTALQYFTGSKEHNVRVREIAQDKGLSLSEYAFKRRDGTELLCAEEEAVYAALDLPWIPPELREDRGEIAAAREGRLPKMLELRDIKGDLHIHTTWSDGQASIAEMAEVARAQGYQYIAITEHSQSLGVAGGLAPEELRRQRTEIEAVNARYDDFRLLRGVEVEIRADGVLDLPDDLLAELDVVIASIHSSLRQPRDRITARLVAAMRNPHVDIIGHPTGRILGQRDETEVDMDEVLRVAAETSTILEVNSGPQRLDLDEVYIRRAVEMGIKLVVNSDAHQPNGLANMFYGVAMARRGWAEAKDVLNTWPLEELHKNLKRLV
jgi:DNA polymerase (family 10)